VAGDRPVIGPAIHPTVFAAREMQIPTRILLVTSLLPVTIVVVGACGVSLVSDYG
jgi:hypothetical protein